MKTIGRENTSKIAVACDDSTVRIYDSVTGAIKLSLRPEFPILEMTGVPDGSLLVCTHKGCPFITLWDVQTGGLAHTFILKGEAEVKRTTVSLEGRYLACETSENTVCFWETTSRTQHPDHLEKLEGHTPCWLAPEELIMVVNGGSVYVRNVVTKGPSVHKLDMLRSVHSAVYSQTVDRLAIMSPYFLGNTFTILDVKTGTTSTLHSGSKRLSFVAFSQTTQQLVCGGEAPGLETVDISTGCWTHFDFPATPASISMLSNGTVVTHARGTGIQLLRLDQGYALPQQSTPPPLTMYPLDKGRIIAIVPTTDDCVLLLETTTMSHVFSIPTRKDLWFAADHTGTLSASLENKIALHSFQQWGENFLQVWEFSHQHPRWTVPTGVLASVGSISPACTRLATFHEDSGGSVCLWDAYNGRLLAQIFINDPCAPRPLDITFNSEDQFSFYDKTHRAPHVINTASRTGNPTTHSITRCAKQRLDGQVLEKCYCLDDGREWVICGLQRICWVPPGYIGSIHCWAGSSLLMVGQDGTLRKLTFPDSSLYYKAYLPTIFVHVWAECFC